MASTASEIVAFMVAISGWVLVSSTLPTDYWKVSTIDGTVITTATYWANLWKTCVTDSTGVSNCKDFPSMLALDGLHPPRPLPRALLLPTSWQKLWIEKVQTGTEKTQDSLTPSLRQKNKPFSAGYIQACRGLMIAAVSLGFFGSIFALFGMKCTKVGGSEKAKAKIACLAGIVFILSGLCSMTGCSLYANKITTEFFDPLYVEQK
ncbi:Claudin-10 [Galemys pyrenaicus]|uniref:Claudin n=1 Tax=Galemys pyrenaicus TaxID=202257 RepID=A0A8J6AUK7_GALPY|nr:Claudin-10 [Galemys pyrenaicus]